MTAKTARSEPPGVYNTNTNASANQILYKDDLVRANDDAIIALALNILSRRMVSGPCIDTPRAIRDYLQLKLGQLEHEVFAVVFLTSQHNVIATEILFTGTLTQTSVYPREVVKAALRHNSGAIILAHNHPSGIAEPSRADEYLTSALKQALSLVDVRVLDHIIVASQSTVSFAERGLL